MSAVATPGRTLEQRLTALQNANRVRVFRSEMKRDLTLDRAVRLIDRTPPWMKTMKVEQLLHALPGWGHRRVTWMLLTCRIASGKTIGGLSTRQRAELARVLSEHGYVPKVSTQITSRPALQTSAESAARARKAR